MFFFKVHSVLPADLGEESKYRPKPLCPASTTKQVRVLSSETMPALCFGSFDFLGLCNNQQIKEAAAITMREFGCGSCGPRGFYGTTRLHLDLEKKLKTFFNTEDAILYSYGNATPCSVIPAFGTAGTFIVWDDGCSYGVRMGVKLSRAKVTHLFISF